MGRFCCRLDALVRSSPSSTKRAAVRPAGVVNSGSRRNHREVCLHFRLHSPPAQANRSTRAAGRIDPPAARVVEFPWAGGVDERTALSSRRQRDVNSPTPRTAVRSAGGFFMEKNRARTASATHQQGGRGA